MEKKRVLNQSPSLFDAPGTEALALQNIIIRQSANSWRLNILSMSDLFHFLVLDSRKQRS